MDWLQFFSSVIGSLAWPSAVVLLAILIRAPLAKVIPRLRTIKYGDLHLDIGEQIDAVKEEVEAIDESPSQDVDEVPVSFRALAKTDARAAVLSAWIPLETELIEIASKLNEEVWRGSGARNSVMFINRALLGEGLIDKATFGALEQLRRIRNSAVHATGEGVTFDDAMNMAEVCQRMIGLLKQIKDSLNR